MKRRSRPCILAALLVVVSTLPPFCSALRRDSLTRGSSLSVEDDTDILVSQDESFACGFYKAGSNAYAFSVWFANSANATAAWTANRDQLVNGRGSRITLRRDGRLELTDFDGTLVWSSNTSSGSADRALLLNTGNLVVVDANNTTLWQSFDSPTDTLLPMQPITKGTPLVSASASGLLSSGYYRFYFDTDNVLRLIYDGPTFPASTGLIPSIRCGRTVEPATTAPGMVFLMRWGISTPAINWSSMPLTMAMGSQGG
ncbi:receptor protein kinase [Musa troglodytarum]|uniref:Receptor protein kinase n=1 Tax=Musa troglodytarum TaxID=320322 RepID=A0A9E7KVP0_9LILI|nr:receptor protein kinase [Musa troglodytarum]